LKYFFLFYNDEEGNPDGLPEPRQDVVTIRVRNGRLSAADGPLPGAGARLRRVVLVSARDYNEAIRIASRMPEARLGSIEVRPVEDLG
jgi:hypothetical protein